MTFQLLLYLAIVSSAHLAMSQTSEGNQQYEMTESQHALLYSRPRSFERTADASKTSFTEEEKVLLLQLHNAYRSMVQPPARNMRELLWDDDLEEYARQHSQACSGAHSARSMVKNWSPLVTERWDLMAENLYWSYGDRYSIEEALWMFWEEGSGYNIYNNSCSHRLTCGHYKALVLESSWRVGCSINQCERFSNNPYPGPAMFMTCSYNGMYVDSARPYTVGESCSGCDRRTVGSQHANCRTRLCVTRTQLRRGTGFDGNTTLIGLQPSDFTYTERTTQVHKRQILDETTTTSAPAPPTTTPVPTTTTTMPPTTTEMKTTTTTMTPTTTGIRTTTTMQPTTTIWRRSTSTMPPTTTRWQKITTTMPPTTTTMQPTTTTMQPTTTTMQPTTTTIQPTTTIWRRRTSTMPPTTTSWRKITTTMPPTTTTMQPTTTIWRRGTSTMPPTTTTTMEPTTTKLPTTTTTIAPTTTPLATTTWKTLQPTTLAAPRSSWTTSAQPTSESSTFYTVTFVDFPDDLDTEWAELPDVQDGSINKAHTIGPHSRPFFAFLSLLLCLLSLKAI